jgi:glycosyltransferase involved in cell wall biosynthesis
MKILLLNTYPHGGAGTACRRLQHALQGADMQVQWLSNEQIGGKWPFFAERLSFLPFERDKSVRFSFSLANVGHDLRRHPLVQQADVLHLHWINQGFLSLKNIQQLGALGKPIVWTLHDMWAFTGGCHYSGDCRRYEQGCGHCPYLRRPGTNDLSARIFQQKQQHPAHIRFVTCSAWLRDVARSSALLRHFSVEAIPNPIDTTVYQPAESAAVQTFRRRLGIPESAFVLLFSAMKVSEERKGFLYLQEALHRLSAQVPAQALHLVVMGKSDPDALSALPYPVHALGMVSGDAQLAAVYAASDAFIIPSLEDNLPNTVMESLACGTPVVGFHTGGIPEMTGHLKEGFIAPQRDSAALAQGIQWVMNHPDPAGLRAAARAKVKSHYAENIVAAQYKQTYTSVNYEL